MLQDNHTFFKISYAVFALSMLMQFTSVTIIPGTILIVIALLMVYDRRKKLPGQDLESHATWLIRTFWIGGTLWLPLLTVAGSVVFAINMDLSEIAAANDRGEILNEQQIMSVMMNENGPLLKNTFYSVAGIFSLWWLCRLWQGFNALRRGQEVKNPQRYF
jgi:uncharacterized membrane protein